MGYHGRSLGSNEHLAFPNFIHIYFQKSALFRER